MSKLWSSFQTRVPHVDRVPGDGRADRERPRRRARRCPCSRGAEADLGRGSCPSPMPPYPRSSARSRPDGQEAALLGETVTLRGHHLEGDGHGTARGPPAREPLQCRSCRGGGDGRVAPRLPGRPDAPPRRALRRLAGRTRGRAERETNAVAARGRARAPDGRRRSRRARNPDGDVTLTVTCRPEVLPAQRGLAPPRQPRGAAPRRTPTRPGRSRSRSCDATPGEHWLRLRVDGVDSLLVDRSVTPPVFDPGQRVAIT